MEELEISLMQIISYSGEARSLCFEALQSYRDGDKEAGRKQYKDAEENLYTAKRAHSRILKQSGIRSDQSVNGSCGGSDDGE